MSSKFSTKRSFGDIDSFSPVVNGKYQRGENGCVELTQQGVGDSRVSLFFSLVRDLSDDSLRTQVAEVLRDARDENLPLEDAALMVADVFVMMFHTRNCRGGKGEKSLSYKMLLQLYTDYPDTTLAILPLIKEFGYFKDYFVLLEMTSGVVEKAYEPFRHTILEIVSSQLKADVAEVSRNPTHPKLSLCGKYVPRSNTRYSTGVNKPGFEQLKTLLFPEQPHLSGALYRKMLAELSPHLDTTEVKMCTGRFREIDFAKVPSLCTNRCRKAFLNEKITRPPVLGRMLGSTQLFGNPFTAVKSGVAAGHTAAFVLTGDRYPEKQDRVDCRSHFRDAIRGRKVHGKQLFPHEIVKQIRDSTLTPDELELMDAQWSEIRRSLVEKLNESEGSTDSSLACLVASSTLEGGDEAKRTSRPSNNAMRLDRLVPLVDVSGSMSGTPMEVAIALGILTSEVNHPAFRNRFLTFESSPRWVDLQHARSIAEKVKITGAAPWGGSTNVEAAFDLIATVVLSSRLPASEVPDLIIFSDMQFDQANGNERRPMTQMERIQRRFHDIGVQLCGEPYPAPRIVFWNLRGNTRGCPAECDMDNVQLLSGFSPSLLELVLTGEEIEESTAEAEVDDSSDIGAVGRVKVKAKVNPYMTFRRAVDCDKYDVVREVLAKSSEDILQHYTFAASTTSSSVSVSALEAEKEASSVAMEATTEPKCVDKSD